MPLTQLKMHAAAMLFGGKQLRRVVRMSLPIHPDEPGTCAFEYQASAKYPGHSPAFGLLGACSVVSCSHSASLSEQLAVSLDSVGACGKVWSACRRTTRSYEQLYSLL